MMCFIGDKKSPPFSPKGSLRDKEGISPQGSLWEGVVETGLLSRIKLENLMATTPGPSLHRRGVHLALIYNLTQVRTNSNQ